MTTRPIGHVHPETRDLPRTAAFRKAPGSSSREQWGTDGPGGRPSAFDIFFNADGLDHSRPDAAVEVITPLEATHRGPRRMRFGDSDRRVYSLGENSGGG